jgi:hypothetical protein
MLTLFQVQVAVKMQEAIATQAAKSRRKYLQQTSQTGRLANSRSKVVLCQSRVR